MTRMPRAGRSRIGIVALAFVLVAVVALIAGSALKVDDVAAASNCTYYSDATYSVVVGQFGHDCCNNRVAWGHKTQFVDCGGCFPCFPPPR